MTERTKAMVRERVLGRIQARRAQEQTSDRRAKKLARIKAKLEAGKELTQEELDFLRRNDPALYAKAMRAVWKRRMVEERLKNAHTRAEVAQIEMEALGSIRPNDPDRAILTAAVQDAIREFREGGGFQRLPVDSGSETPDASRKMQDASSVVRYAFGAGGYQIAYAEEKDGEAPGEGSSQKIS